MLFVSISRMAELLKGPDEKQMEEIRKDLGEDPDRFANNLKLLEEWIKCQPHLPQDYGENFCLIKSESAIQGSNMV